MLRASGSKKKLESILFLVILGIIIFVFPGWLSNNFIIFGLIVAEILWAFFYQGYMDIFDLPVIGLLLLRLLYNLMN